jgi:hypothetical protein
MVLRTFFRSFALCLWFGIDLRPPAMAGSWLDRQLVYWYCHDGLLSQGEDAGRTCADLGLHLVGSATLSLNSFSPSSPAIHRYLIKV